MSDSAIEIALCGEGLSLSNIAAVARGAKVRLTSDTKVRDRVEKSLAVIRNAVLKGEQVYGVTTLFGGMADQYVGSTQDSRKRIKDPFK